MNAGALPARPAIEATASAVAYRACYAAVAVAAGVAAVLAPQNDAALGPARYAGAAIVASHTIATHLGHETLSAPGSPSAAAGWLGALATYVFASGSAAAGTFAAAIVALLTFALVERRARRIGGRVFGLAAALLAALCAIGSFGCGAGIFTAAFAVVLAEVLDRPGRRSTIVATALAVVWCNVAPQGLLAPAIAFVFALGAVAEGRSEAERRSRWEAVLGTAVAAFATPGFLAYPGIALLDMRLDRDLAAIVSLHPAELVPIAYRSGFFLAAFAAFAVGLRQRRAGDVLLFFAAGLLALENGAYLCVFGVLAAPLLAASAAEAFPRIASFDAGNARGDAMAGIAGAVLALVALVLAAQHLAPPAPGYALAATLARDGHPHRLFCSNVDWCGTALGEGSSQTQVFMDARLGAYPEGVRDAQHDIVRLKNHWRRTLDREGVDTLLVHVDRPLAGMIALWPAWHVVASDDEAVLYERSPP